MIKMEKLLGYQNMEVKVKEVEGKKREEERSGMGETDGKERKEKTRKKSGSRESRNKRMEGDNAA